MSAQRMLEAVAAFRQPVEINGVSLPPIYPEWLGDRTFGEVHGARFPYASGAMANGIATARMVVEMARAGFMGFFGAAGLDPRQVEAEIEAIQAQAGGGAWGSNLIHSPQTPDLEEAIVDLYLRRGVERVSAAAYMRLTPAVVRYAVTGLRQTPAGGVYRRHHLFAKVSRPEVARRFMSPAPADLLDLLLSRGQITPQEAALAARVPVAEDFTVEGDSGGHTDNQALTALLPIILGMRDELMALHRYPRPIRIGAAGGLGAPQAVAAAFAMGAAYVVTGSINQSAVESGLHPDARALLGQVGLGDVMMAPAADMFELGVEVQVLRRGVLFGPRAKRLYDLYSRYPSLEAIPAPDQARLAREILQDSLPNAWERVADYWRRRDPGELARAEADPKHKMALIFRGYLGQASRWAIAGDPARRADYQIWCGPALAAFNAWVKGSHLEPLDGRRVVDIAQNLMEGASALTRAQQLRVAGLPVPAAAFHFRPRPLS
ncbi:PfaD family polyunsaturated fatty acid/polyketide biosynthesis protein [Myxococcota bacterium]|nr:PfaD family polyunsaturated fatty acid/polyketide biosynthesis protein [Myxococcota bacterium]